MTASRSWKTRWRRCSARPTSPAAAKINLANLTDGLRAEREQGITIDVAYRYFRHAPPEVHRRRHPRPRAVHPQHGHRRLHRQPGHHPDRCPQGRDRTNRRHAYIASLLGIPHLLVCMNKMDLVAYSAGVFNRFARILPISARAWPSQDITFIPVSALNGDNIVERSDTCPGISARPCFAHLEDVYIGNDRNLQDPAFRCNM
jgi:bifunctional enzyme CysN/CysC